MEALVVAHPDDETLWAGGYLLRHPDTTVICCSVPRHDSIRAWKFFDACDSLGVKGRIIPATESAPDKPLEHLGVLDLSRYDTIITHGKDGEYGHLHHKQVHEFITSYYPEKNILSFGFGKGEIRLELTEDEQQRKLAALQCYDHIWPYQGRNIPKWRALMERYVWSNEVNFKLETYTWSNLITSSSS
jgi:LmbE family N-acetylglucosaminyl deacetylase